MPIDIKQSLLYQQIKKQFTPANLFYGVALLLLVVMMIKPEAKAIVIRGLMQIGLFQPDIEPAKTEQLAPEIIFKDDNGANMTLSALKGKVVLINFWATWCPPCVAEMPTINALSQQLKNEKDIVFLMTDVDNDFKKSTQFMAKHQYYLRVYQAITAIPDSVAGSTIPCTLIINKRGAIVFKHTGAADYSNLKMTAFLKSLLAE